MREETSMYEWDEAKRRSNQVKHDVDFKIIEAFDWDTALINASHHGGEFRFVATGLHRNAPARRCLYPTRGQETYHQSAQGEQQGESPLCPSLDPVTAR